MKRLKANAANLMALVTLVALSLLIAGCSPSGSQTGESNMAGGQDFEPHLKDPPNEYRCQIRNWITTRAAILGRDAAIASILGYIT